MKSSRAGASSESLTTTDSRAGAGSQSLTTADSQGAVCSRNQMTSGKSRATSSETSPGDPSSLGVDVTLDASPAGASLTESRSAMNRPDGLPGGRIIQVKIRTPFAHTVTADDGANTTDRGSSVNWMHSFAEANGTAGMDQADMVGAVSMTTHTTGDPYSSLLPRTVALEKDQAMKTLPIQPTVSAHDGNTSVPPVSILIMAGLHNPSSMAVPSTGMDVQYGPSD